MSQDDSLHYYAEEFLLYITSVRELSQNSIVAYKNDLHHLEIILGADTLISDVTTEDLRFCIARLSEMKLSSTSINRFIAAVRTFFAYCRRFEYIKINPAVQLKSVRIAKHMPRFLTSAEVDKLCKQPVVKELLWANRDRAIFEMMYSSGCRISELASLKISDFKKDFTSAIVLGKGNKERQVFFAHDAVNAINNYLADRNKIFLSLNKKDEEKCFFVNQRGNGLTVQGIRWILARYSGHEGINHHVSPHALRHTFATAMLLNGADVRIVQEMLGHSSVSTTQRYTHITTDKLIDIYNKAHPHSK